MHWLCSFGGVVRQYTVAAVYDGVKQLTSLPGDTKVTGED